MGIITGLLKLMTYYRYTFVYDYTPDELKNLPEIENTLYIPILTGNTIADYNGINRVDILVPLHIGNLIIIDKKEFEDSLIKDIDNSIKGYMMLCER